MKRAIGILCLLGVAGGVVMILSCAPMRSTPARPGEAAAGKEGYLSPIAVIADRAGERLYVAEHTGCQVAVVDVASGEVRRKLPLPGEATGLTLTPDGKRLLVTAGMGDGKVVIFDAASGRRTGEFDAGHSPMAPVVGRDGTIYVCDRFGDSVLAFVKGSTTPVVIGVSRQPVGLGLGDGGRTLVVINHLPAGRGDGDFTAAVVTLIDTDTNKVVKEIPLPDGGTVVRDVAISPDGTRACVTHVLARYHLQFAQIERGWVNTYAITLIDVQGKRIVNTVLLDDVDKGAANAWGVAWTPDGKFLCVTQAGTHDISIIDWAGLSKKLAASEADGRGAEVQNNLEYLAPLRRRIKLEGNSPRGLTTIGSKVYATMYFSDTLCTLDVKAGVKPAARTISLGPVKPLTKARLGEMYFNDARLSFQQWLSCASCHPDARSDGLNRDSPSGMLSNPKSTKSVVLAHKTPPAMVTGSSSTAENAVRMSIRLIQFAVRPEKDAVCIDEYLKSLRPVPSPHLARQADGSLGLSEPATRGKVLFQTARCATCHNGPYLTDMKKYDVGTGTDYEKKREFDTPTLREVWRNGPYLYDGRAATMREVFEKFNPNDKHGTTSRLNARQIADLCQYVLSL